MTMASSKLLLSHPIDRIRNAGSGRIGRKQQADVGDGTESRHTTSGGARSAVVAYWNDGSGD